MRKLLIVKLGAIGDVLRTTALLPGLREKYDPLQIDWMTSEIAQELLEGNPYLRRVLTWEEKDGLDNYDLVIGLEDDREVCRFVANLAAREAVGAYLKGGKVVYSPSAWFDMSVISRYGIDRANALKKSNRKTYQQHMADLLGIKISPYVFRLTADEVGYGQQAVKALGISKGDRVVGVNSGAGKRWPQKSWGIGPTVDLINKLKKEAGIISLILGGTDERERNQIIAAETGMPDAGVHSLRGFASIINQCSAVLASDSLAMHFAIALGKRLVAFFGPTSAAEIELYGLGEKLTPAVDCTVCYKKSCEVKPDCLDRLSVNEVLAAVKRQFG